MRRWRVVRYGRGPGIGTLLLGLASAAVTASACQEAGDDGGGQDAGAGAGGEAAGHATAGSTATGGRPTPSDGGQSGGGPDSGGRATMANGGEAGAHGGGLTAQDGGAAGSAAEPAEGGGGGAGGGAPTACGQASWLGTRRIDVIHEKRTCIFHSDDPEVVPPGCGPFEKVDEGTVTFSLFQQRDLPWSLSAVLDGGDVALGPEGTDNPEIWPGTIFAGQSDDPQTMTFPISDTDGACSSLPASTSGGARIDFDLATGRVSHFERVCFDEYRTYYDEFRVTAGGEQECNVVTCNGIVNAAPPAVISHTQPVNGNVPSPSGGELTSGTYYLKTADYPARSDCEAVPAEWQSSISETLVIEASSPTSGTISWVSERSTLAPRRSVNSYEVVEYAGLDVLKTKHICGEELWASWAAYGVWFPDASMAYFSASANELRVEVPGECGGTSEFSQSIYTYEKQ